MLVADRVTFGYGANTPPVVTDVSLTIASGQVVGLAGPSGAGKSTLARLLTGYLTPDAGTIRVDGASLPRTGVQPVQMLFQAPEFAVNPRWKISQILTEFSERNTEVWERFGIHNEWLDRYPHELSGGEIQRVATARTLSGPVRYVVADEISGMLDTITQAALWKALLSVMAKRRIGILAISHDMHLLKRICVRILNLECGVLSQAWE
jgi:ABC-type dipeptide/oligopeptide/nickel transport system ATPase subunit